MQRIEVIPMIRREMSRNHLTPAEFARKLKVAPSSVQGLLNHSTIQVQKVAQLSEVFQYNFFREIAAMFPYTDPDYTLKTVVDQEKEELKESVKALKLEVTILRQTLKDLTTR